MFECGAASPASPTWPVISDPQIWPDTATAFSWLLFAIISESHITERCFLMAQLTRARKLRRKCADKYQRKTSNKDVAANMKVKQTKWNSISNSKSSIWKISTLVFNFELMNILCSKYLFELPSTLAKWYEKRRFYQFCYTKLKVLHNLFILSHSIFYSIGPLHIAEFGDRNPFL